MKLLRKLLMLVVFVFIICIGVWLFSTTRLSAKNNIKAKQPDVQWCYSAVKVTSNVSNIDGMNQTFNKLGAQGWELVNFRDEICVFKKKVEPVDMNLAD